MATNRYICKYPLKEGQEEICALICCDEIEDALQDGLLNFCPSYPGEIVFCHPPQSDDRKICGYCPFCGKKVIIEMTGLNDKKYLSERELYDSEKGELMTYDKMAKRLVAGFAKDLISIKEKKEILDI